MLGIYPDIENKTFLVTGASSGIGQAIALALSEQKARVIVTGRSSRRLAETLQQMSRECEAIEADLTSDADLEILCSRLPALDGICHSAGIIKPFPVRLMDKAEFDKVFSINAMAPIALTSQLLRKKKINANGSIVFISSIASAYSHIGSGSYSCSKAAVEAYSRSIAIEHAKKGIRSNCLKPALVESPILEQARELSAQEKAESYIARYPLGIGCPADVAAAALFFLSRSSRWITGTTLTLDGGLTAGL